MAQGVQQNSQGGQSDACCAGGRVYLTCTDCGSQPRQVQACTKCGGAGTTWSPCPSCAAYASTGNAVVANDATYTGYEGYGDGGSGNWQEQQGYGSTARQ